MAPAAVSAYIRCVGNQRMISDKPRDSKRWYEIYGSWGQCKKLFLFVLASSSHTLLGAKMWLSASGRLQPQGLHALPGCRHSALL